MQIIDENKYRTLKINGAGYSQREVWADIAKGIGVLLVILGHTSQLPEIAIEWIYSFHMSLFFWISGYFYRDVNDAFVYVKKKSKSLLLPYVVYCLVFLAINNFVIREDNSIILRELIDGLSGQGTDGILWFFPALFWTEILFYILKKYAKAILPFLICLCVVLADIYCSSSNYQSGLFKIPSAMFSIGFYYIGYLIHQNNMLDKIKKVPLLVYLVIHGVLLLMCHPNLSLNTASTSNVITAYLIAVLGIFAIIKSTDIFKAKWTSFFGAVLAYLGKNSVYYYPITGYVPVAFVKILTTIGVSKNVVIVLFSKAVGFVVATGVCVLGKRRQK